MDFFLYNRLKGRLFNGVFFFKNGYSSESNFIYPWAGQLQEGSEATTKHISESSEQGHLRLPLPF